MKIVSGGQTGADRAALDAAMEAGVPCDGWCPADRNVEDGMIPDRYPVPESPEAGYAHAYASTRGGALRPLQRPVATFAVFCLS
jgi:hypothetical protein